MNADYNKHNIVKYLANNKDKDIWKMSVSSIGFQSTKFLDSYPPKGLSLIHIFFDYMCPIRFPQSSKSELHASAPSSKTGSGDNNR